MEYPTPPDTVTVRKQLLRHRESLSAAKDSIISSDPSSPDNAFGTLKAHRPFNGDFFNKHKESLKSLLMYENPAASFGVIFLAVFGLSTIRYILNGAHEITFLSAISYLLIFDLSVNFARSIFVSSSSASHWSGSPVLSMAVAYSTKAINYTAALHDQFLSAKEPVLSLRVGITLWVIATVGRVFSIWTLVTTAFVLAFTVPYFMANNMDVLSAYYHSTMDVVIAKYNSLGLTRKQKAIGASIAVLCVWLYSSWLTRFSGLLIGALAVRCQLSSAEIEALRDNPLTRSVRKKAAHFRVAANDFAVRTLGKSHATPH